MFSYINLIIEEDCECFFVVNELSGVEIAGPFDTEGESQYFIDTYDPADMSGAYEDFRD